MAFADDALHAIAAILALVGALFIQIGTNLYNDYADFQKGADTHERQGPTRVTQAGLIAPDKVLLGAVVSFAIAVVAGGYLMWRGGWPIVMVGFLSIFFGFAYTAGKYSLSYTGLADIVVLVFFGPVAVAGTYYVQALDVNQDVLVAGLAPGLLAVAILLVNNIRDFREDALAGKRTLVARMGQEKGVVLYLACILLATAVPVYLALDNGRSVLFVAAGLVLLGGVILFRRLSAADDGVTYNRLLAETGKLLLVYSIGFSIVWIVAGGQ